MHQIRFAPSEPAGGAHDAPPDPLVGWGGETPSQYLSPIDAFGVSVPAPVPYDRTSKIEKKTSVFDYRPASTLRTCGIFCFVYICGPHTVGPSAAQACLFSFFFSEKKAVGRTQVYNKSRKLFINQCPTMGAGDPVNQSISLIATLRPESRISNDMQLKQESVRPRWSYDMRPSVRAEKYIRDASG